MKRSSSRIEQNRLLRIHEEAKQRELEIKEYEQLFQKMQEREKANKEKKLMLQQKIREKAEEERKLKKLKLEKDKESKKNSKVCDKGTDDGICDDNAAQESTVSDNSEGKNEKHIPVKKKRTVQKVKFKVRIKWVNYLHLVLQHCYKKPLIWSLVIACTL